MPQAKPYVLPSDWQDVVARVRVWLDETSAANDQRERDFVVRFPQDAAGIAELDLGTSQVPALPEIEDGDALAAESALRDFSRRSEALRMKLADVAK